MSSEPAGSEPESAAPSKGVMTRLSGVLKTTTIASTLKRISNSDKKKSAAGMFLFLFSLFTAFDLFSRWQTTLPLKPNGRAQTAIFGLRFSKEISRMYVTIMLGHWDWRMGFALPGPFVHRKRHLIGNAAWRCWRNPSSYGVSV